MITLQLVFFQQSISMCSSKWCSLYTKLITKCYAHKKYKGHSCGCTLLREVWDHIIL